MITLIYCFLNLLEIEICMFVSIQCVLDFTEFTDSKQLFELSDAFRLNHINNHPEELLIILLFRGHICIINYKFNYFHNLANCRHNWRQ